MESQWLRDLLENVQDGETSVEDALARLRGFPMRTWGLPA